METRVPVKVIIKLHPVHTILQILTPNLLCSTLIRIGEFVLLPSNKITKSTSQLSSRRLCLRRSFINSKVYLFWGVMPPYSFPDLTKVSVIELL